MTEPPMPEPPFPAAVTPTRARQSESGSIEDAMAGLALGPSVDMPARIAVIDDMEPNALLLAATMETLPGLRPVVFTSGEKALDWCLAEDPDLILLDYQMPELDGLGFTTRLRAARPEADPPILMITSDESSATLRAAFDAGVTDFLRKPVDEVELIARCLNLLRLRLRSRALVEMNRRLTHLAHYDSLTGILNRRRFMELADYEITRCARYRRPASLIILDLDRFKDINDGLGHAAGDAALVATARSIRAVLRETDVLGRLGGEEFVILLPETALPQAVDAAERVRRAIAATTIEHDRVALRVTASLGLADWQGGADTLDSLLHRADAAMYRAKDGGRNQVQIALPAGDD